MSRPVLISALLGINCWVTCVAMPSWHLWALGALSGWVLLGDILALTSLVLGVLALFRRHRASVFLLLGLFPVLVILPSLVQPSLIRAAVLSPLAVVIAGASFAVYLIGGCWAASAIRVRHIAATQSPLEDQVAHRRKRLSLMLLTVAVAVVAITLGTAHLQIFEAGDTGKLRLLSVAALALWASALFGIIAPALRQRRPWPLPAASRGAAVVWLLVVALGAIMLLLSTSD